jgi:hypothetical protein
MRPVLDSSSFVPVPPTQLASILLLAFLLSALVSALSQCLCSESPYLSIKLYRICLLNEYHIIYSVRYYLRFHITTVDLTVYYPRIWGHYSIHILLQVLFMATYHASIISVATGQANHCLSCISVPSDIQAHYFHHMSTSQSHTRKL